MCTATKTRGFGEKVGTLSIKNIDDDEIIAHSFFGTCSHVPVASGLPVDVGVIGIRDDALVMDR